MKSRFFLSGLLLWGMCCSDGPVRAARFALIVALGDYPSYTSHDGRTIYQLPKLEGFRNDADLMVGLLTTRYGFSKERIRVLTRHEATWTKIQQGFQWLQWVARSSTDIVVVYLSGHGYRVQDWNGDEREGLEKDRDDEALIPWDYYFYDDKAKRDSFNLILDDDIQAWLAPLPTPEVTLIADTCFSGSLDKNLMDPYPSKYGGPLGRVPGLSAGAKEMVGGGALDYDERHVLIAACQYHEQAREISLRDPETQQEEVVGGFTLALYQSLYWQPAGMKCEELASRLETQMDQLGLSQTPEFRGNYMGRWAIAPPPPTGPRKAFVPMEQDQQRQPRLRAGFFAGLQKDQHLDFFAPADQALANPLGSLKITQVRAKEAEVEVTSSRQGWRPGCHAVPTTLPWPDTEVKYRLQTRSAFPHLLEELTPFDFLDLGEEAEGVPDGAMEVNRTEDGKWEAQWETRWGPNQRVKIEAATEEELRRKLRDRLETSWVWRQFSQLDNPHTDWKFRIWTEHRNNVFSLGDLVRFRIVSDRDAYVTLLTLSSTGKLCILFPNQYQPDHRIEGGREYWIPPRETPPGARNFRICVAPPESTDLVVAVATTERLNLVDQLPSETSSEPFYSPANKSLFARDFLAKFSQGVNSKPLVLQGDESQISTTGWAVARLVVKCAVP